MKRTTFITALSAVASVSIILALLVLGLFFGQNVLLPAVITAVFILLLAMVFYSLDLIKNETNKQIENQLELAYKEVLSHGDIGILHKSIGIDIAVQAVCNTGLNIHIYIRDRLA
ncbi:MAG: hypothetical protein II606_05760, partial [Erysipelotrichaceae bacterium]|nr:hypothetical protein [Erysipelotrichaceae bacterium]